MRALSVRAPRDASIVHADPPEIGPGQLLVRIAGCGVCASDLNAWRGVPGVEYPLPIGAPGHEAWGEVVAVGDAVDARRVGERVTGLLWNGFAELGVARAENVLALPRSLPELPGEPLACAMNVVRRSGIQPGQRLAIVGFGYLAALIVQLLPEGASEWIALSRRAASRDLALRLGASAAYDFDAVPSAAWDSFPVVIEAAGVQQTLDLATWLTGFGGRLVIAGYHADGPRTVNMQSWNWKGIDVVNAHERQPSAYVAGLRAAFDLLAHRPMDLSTLHTNCWSLDDAIEAFRFAEERPPSFVKGFIRP